MSKSMLVIDAPAACIDYPCHFAHEDGMAFAYAAKEWNDSKCEAY